MKTTTINKTDRILLMITLLLLSCSHYEIKRKDLCLKNGADAIKIVEQEWLKIYGKTIYDKKPFKAKLINDTIWVVNGTLSYGELGGVPYAEINAKDCQIIKVTHGK